MEASLTICNCFCRRTEHRWRYASCCCSVYTHRIVL